MHIHNFIVAVMGMLTVYSMFRCCSTDQDDAKEGWIFSAVAWTGLFILEIAHHFF